MEATLIFQTTDQLAYEKVMALIAAITCEEGDLSNEIMYAMSQGATPREALEEWDLI